MKNRFSWRVFISFGLVYVFVAILSSGIILYMSPPGRYAHWVNWKILGLTKESWQTLHTVFSYTFVVLSVFHLFTMNWKAFFSYIRSKTKNGLNRKKELLVSSALFVLFFIGIVFSVPPFKTVMDFGGYLADSWEKAEEEPPIPHAELLTLAELDDQLKDLTLDDIVKNLNRYQIQYNNTELQTLSEIAELNTVTPLEIYQKIIKKPESQLLGSGIGKKTIEEFVGELGKNADDVLKILNDNGIKSEKGRTLKEIGDNNNIPPVDIYNIITKE